jgi:hypothetical protein
MSKYYIVHRDYDLHKYEEKRKKVIADGGVYYLAASKATEHIVRADDEDDALRIANKHSIKSSRMEMKDITTTWVQEVLPDDNVIERRRRGKGGSVFYEDENGNLQKEGIS